MAANNAPIKLNATQRAYLTTLQHAADRIILSPGASSPGTEPALSPAAAATLATLPPLVNSPHVPLFTNRLRQLPGQLMKQLSDNFLTINDNLPASEAASVYTMDYAPNPYVQSFQLRSSLLDPETIVREAPRIQVERVRTLLHEVSHSLLVPKEFPVKDYIYAKGWSITQLGSLSPFNADTYAEVVALIAEVESNKPYAYRTLSIPRAQQAVFQPAAGTASLSAALALVDLRINRAWLRAADYLNFAKDSNAKEPRADDNPDRKELWVIETELQRFKIVGARTSGSHSKDSITQATDLAGAIERVKPLPTRVRVRLVATPNLVFVSDGPMGPGLRPVRRLDIPRERLSHGLASQLADDILAMMRDEAFATTGAVMRAHGLELIKFLVLHDRPRERERLTPRINELEAIQGNPLNDASWLDMQLGTHIAALEVIAQQWARGVARLDSEPEYKRAPRLDGIAPEHVDTVRALIADVKGFTLQVHAPARDRAVTAFRGPLKP
ncbi:hypothetical protein C8J57DRAFT_1515876 [Mycena rebaudengoi]|nr:hypothetical protein C8J57DRAFT_1515876 [Mycena rebaudengoi]